VGGFLKSPLLPVWVVCSESHYSVLYGADDDGGSGSGGATSPSPSGGGGGGMPRELLYYDPLAGQDAPIRLLLSSAPPGDSWAARLAGASRERGCWRGAPIPPLELVVATRWPDAAVEWRGCEPLL
jgi:hypothetical protein